MKTSSSLLFLALFAACPVVAQVVADSGGPVTHVDPVEPIRDPGLEPLAGHEALSTLPLLGPVVKRCDTDFLEGLAKAPSGGVTTSDESVGAPPKLNFGDKVCDAATWRHLAFGDPPVWRNSEAKRHWDAGSDRQRAALLLVVDDFFKAFDQRALAFLADNAVIEAGVRLGIVTSVPSDKSLSELLPEASGVLGYIKPKTATFVPEGEQTVSLPPDQLGPTFRLLLDENGASNSGGVAVRRFRLAVFELYSALGRAGGSNNAVRRRLGAPLPGVKDFTPGLPNGYVYRADKAAALDDAKFKEIVASLVGAGAAPALNDGAPRADALLDAVDLGLRNLVAIRAAEVERIVAAAKNRLKGKTISRLEVSARAAEAVKDMPADSLPAAVLQRLAETPQYAQLDSLYENRKRRDGDVWVNSSAGQAMAAAREELKVAALSAHIEEVGGQKAVVFTQDGRKKRLGSLVPENVESDPAMRADAAAIISRLIIMDLPVSAKYRAAVAAFRGAGQPGQPLRPNLRPSEVAVSREVPPAIQKIKGGAAGCESPKDLIRNDYETYAARQRAAAAAMAGANARSRRDVEKKKQQELAAAEVVCNRELDAAAEIKKDYFDAPAVAQAARKRAKAKALERCVEHRRAIELAAQARIEEIAAQEAGDRNPDALRAKADQDLAAGFSVAVAASIEILRKEYTTAGSPRLRRLSRMTGDSPRLTGFTERWFAQKWPLDKPDELKTAIDACVSALGLGGKKISYRNPENPNNVDRSCKINEELTSYILSRANQSTRVPVRRNP